MNIEKITQKQLELYSHPLLNNHELLADIKNLRVFMERHVYAVWDFMCLLKSLQYDICPSGVPWMPNQYSHLGVSRIINEIILEEESDIDDNGVVTSHVELYLEAMQEVGANIKPFENFLNALNYDNIISAMVNTNSPECSVEFVESTFNFIMSGKPHVTAAAFTFGRETSIPDMYKNILRVLGFNKDNCKKFFYYLERHVQLDGEEHGPRSKDLVFKLCGNDEVKLKEAEDAAILSIDNRIRLWDGVLNDIKLLRA
ncbi:DUF3050 domain-containing protein [bacterium]|nr:DUF3050 domain-containing protein [bacterium]